MEYNEELFKKIAIPRIVKFGTDKKDFLLVQGVDMDDICQDLRIAIFQSLQKYNNLDEIAVSKLINEILTQRFKNILREGAEQMNTTSEYKVPDEIEEIEPVIKKPKLIKVKINGCNRIISEPVIKLKNGDILKTDSEEFSPRFVNLDEIEEALLVNNSEEHTRIIDQIEYLLSPKEWELIKAIYKEGYTEWELSCKSIKCNRYEDCRQILLDNQEKHTQKMVMKNCINKKAFYSKRIAIQRLKCRIIAKLQKKIK